MSIVKTLIVAAALAGATAAMASPVHLTDSQFVAAARCTALASSGALGQGDASAFAALVKSEGRSRTQVVLDLADEARRDAARQAGHAGATGRSALLAERDGLCQTLVQSGGAGGGAGAGK